MMTTHVDNPSKIIYTLFADKNDEKQQETIEVFQTIAHQMISSGKQIFILNSDPFCLSSFGAESMPAAIALRHFGPSLTTYDLEPMKLVSWMMNAALRRLNVFSNDIV